MALMNFVDKVGPVISAAWLNAVDVLKTTVFNDATTKALARTALTSDAPLELVNGGTGFRTLQEVQNAFGIVGSPVTMTAAATMNLGAQSSHYIQTNGTASITSFGNSASTTNPFYLLQVGDTEFPRIVAGANILTPGNVDIVLSQYQAVLLCYLGSNTWMVMTWYNNTYNFWRSPSGDVVSAATLDLGAVPGNPEFLNVIGSTGITSFGSSGNINCGTIYTLYFNSSLTITAGANLTLPNAATAITVASGDIAIVRRLTQSSWTIINILSKTGAIVTKGTFIPTWTGFSSSPGAAVAYTRVGTPNNGAIVSLRFTSSHSGTSNATTLSFSGLPSDLRPDNATSKRAYVPIIGMKDNGTNLDYPSVVDIDGSGVVNFYKSNATNAWTNTGSKGFTAQSQITYSIDPPTGA